MARTPLILYMVPFMLANGTLNYVVAKRNEKQLLARFDNIKIGKTPTTLKPDISREIDNLVKIIENNIDKDNLNNLYNNLKTAKIKKNFLLLLLGIKGKYSTEKNSIDYSIDGSLEHEIIHLSSAHYDSKNNICQSGFVNYAKKLTFGKAINEGYTDLTSRRLFNKKTSFYSGEVRVVEYLELLIGKKELEKYFFTNDIVSLIKDLSKYIGKEEAINFITTFDLGFDLKKQSNPAYKVIYTNLELKLCKLFEKHNKSLLKQIDYLKLLDKSPITNIINKTKNMTIHKPYICKF